MEAGSENVSQLLRKEGFPLFFIKGGSCFVDSFCMEILTTHFFFLSSAQTFELEERKNEGAVELILL
jgi:hypothetical protein